MRAQLHFHRPGNFQVYIPQQFVMDEQYAMDFIKAHPFALLTSVSANRLVSSHVPLFLKDGKLYGHLAKANRHWQELAHASDIEIVFSGGDAYISPGWYSTSDQVPTWNYETVHVHGNATLIEEAQQLIELVATLSAIHEAQFTPPWTMDKLTDKKTTAMVNAIVGFKIDITSIEGKSKLSQNKQDEIANVIRGLNQMNQDSKNKIITSAMAATQVKSH